MTERTAPRWASWVLDAGLIILLAASWIGGWVATRSDLNALPPGTRAVILNFWLTSHRLWLVPILVAITIALLLLRHWRPLLSFWLGLIVLVFYALQFPMVDYAEFGSTMALLLFAGWAIMSGSAILPIAIGALAAAGAATVQYYGVQQHLADSGQSASPVLTSMSETSGRVVIVAMAMVAAWLVRRLRLQANELADTNQELIRRRSEAAQAAIVDERLRISRELHDVVAHHISTMTVHAGGAARAMTTNTEAAQSSLQQIAESGRAAIGDLQRMLGFLRGQAADDGTRDPTPSLRDLDRLAASFGSDLQVDVELTGPVDAVPASVDLSAYRIVQEALTNAVKHSEAQTASVAVSVAPSQTSIEIVNNQVNGSNQPGTGHGLIGMSERVALHGGEFVAGPTFAGGWRVHAVLTHGTSNGEA